MCYKFRRAIVICNSSCDVLFGILGPVSSIAGANNDVVDIIGTNDAAVSVATRGRPRVFSAIENDAAGPPPPDTITGASIASVTETAMAC